MEPRTPWQRLTRMQRWERAQVMRREYGAAVRLYAETREVEDAPNYHCIAAQYGTTDCTAWMILNCQTYMKPPDQRARGWKVRRITVRDGVAVRNAVRRGLSVPEIADALNETRWRIWTVVRYLCAAGVIQPDDVARKPRRTIGQKETAA